MSALYGFATFVWRLQQVSKVLKGLKITVDHLKYPRTYKSFGLVKSGLAANKHMFPKDGKEVSVAAYFAEAYRPLKYPFLPCLDVGGDRNNPRAMPPEVQPTTDTILKN